MEEIRARFSIIEDLRHQGYVEHKLMDVLILVMCTVFCGLDSLGNIMIFAENNQVFLHEQFGIEKIPSKATLVTADAMHCQRETCRKIISKKGDYLLGLKSNQPSLLEDAALFLSDPINHNLIEIHTTTEKNVGRVEKRICRKITDLSWLECCEKWSGLKTIFSIERIIDVRGHRSEEIQYYISSLDAPPQRLMEIAREHWKIESLHWLLDVTFSEDRCRFLEDNAHKTLNTLRKYALLVHKQFLTSACRKTSIKAHMLACLMNHSLLMQVFKCL